MRVPTRRQALWLLACAPFANATRADPVPPIRDQGIGGTGARPSHPPGDAPDEGGDRGLGGTGVIGTIRRFGSIIVNDLRIAYPKDVAVRIDGAAATVSDLKIGQVVRVVAHEDDTGLSTRHIDVTSEVVGPVEAIAKGTMTVLGQRIAAPPGQSGRWRVGDRVAVSGLRRPDGVVVASLIEARATGPDRVAGRIRRSKDGDAMIGGLRLQGVEPQHIGRRATVTGNTTGSGFTVTRVEETRALFAPGLRKVSIETYLGRNANGVNVGSGFDLSGAPEAGLPRRGSVRAIVTAEPAHDGRLTVEHLRIDTRGSERPSGPAEGGLPRSPDGPRPERFRPEGGRPGGLPGGSPRFEIDTRAPGGAGGFGGGHGGGFGAPGNVERPGGFERPGGGLGRTPSEFGGPGGFGGGRR
jgi:hypothetical protein